MIATLCCRGMRMETCMTLTVICVMQQVRNLMLRGLQSLSTILMLQDLLYLIKSAVKYDSKIVEAETGSIHEVSLVEQAIYQDKDQRHLDEMEFKLEELLKDQLEMTEDMNLHLDFLCKELNGRLETLDTRVKTLYTQASQTAEAVRKQEAMIKENAVEVERHRVDDILDNGFGETLYTQASQTAEAVRKQEAMIKENAVEVERHRVDDILDNGFGEVLE
ncbi:hypothetical protein F2Q69_00059028 [Brassica cretica]|uniref:Uncharacterized protein n=1 Tax=Brassica cretica TaxID=69181 RepID=A0A8S9RB28_BRACR|nr:hypothetical protein F2Q69_00059028 [Brassica cretica]